MPFHFNKQLVNALTLPEFDAKSFEPNYKQCAVQLISQKVPQGIKLKQPEIAAELGYIKNEKEIKEVKRLANKA